MKFRIVTIFLVLIFTIGYADNFLGWYYVCDFIRLKSGCRQDGMGSVGFSLPNDVNSIIINPAGLGIENDKVKNLAVSYGGAISPFPENNTIVHDHYLTLFRQPSEKNIGGFGIFIDLDAQNTSEDIAVTKWENGQIVPTGDTLRDNRYLYEAAFGYGRNFDFWGLEKHAIGISLKVSNRYESNFGEPKNNTSLFLDFGYSGIFAKKVCLGLSALNIPLIKSFAENKKKSANDELNIISALGFSHESPKVDARSPFSIFIELNNKLSLVRVNNDGNFATGESSKTKVNVSPTFSLGAEIGIFEFIFIRNGYQLFDDLELEIATGYGFLIKKKFMIDISYSYLANREYDVDIQRGFHRIGLSLSLYFKKK